MRFLFTTFEGGGHVPPALLVARRLAERGHAVLVVSDEANRAQAAASGLDFQPWERAPNRIEAGRVDDPLDEWRARWPAAIVRRLCDAVVTGPSHGYAQDTLAACERFRPDLIVSNELLFGVLAAAEASATPVALLTANVWCFPTRLDVPPFGPGFPPATADWQHRRDGWVRRVSARWYQHGLADLNRTRAQLGLEALSSVLHQLDVADLVMLGVAKAFDYNATPPAGFAYAGPLAEAPAWAGEGDVRGLLSSTLPNVLVSFSTVSQGQGGVLERCVRALSGLPVHTLVTLGPALADLRLRPRPNLSVAVAAPHDILVPKCRLVVSHAGHGTVVRPLMHGVPVICLPTGRDQPENAARIAAAGAGLRLSPRASTARIRAAARRILSEPSFREAAQRFGQAIAAEADGGRTAADAFEQLAGQRRRIAC
jgi:MGT family glycosyltransferase